jgi:hypothetical protein
MKPMTSNPHPCGCSCWRSVREVFRLAQDQRDQYDREYADRSVDQKAPMPGEIVGQPSAERRPDNRRHHHRDAEQREGLAALGRRERVRQDRLRHRHHAAAPQSLQNPEQQ